MELEINEDFKEYFYYKEGSLFWKKQPANNVKKGDEAGSLNKYGYKQVRFKKKLFYCHRIIWFLFNGKNPIGQIDHINGIRSDNRIENLRVISNRENCQNKTRHREGKLVGAHFKKNNKTKKWSSSIRINGKLFHIGNFDTEEEANKAYLKKLNELMILSGGNIW